MASSICLKRHDLNNYNEATNACFHNKTPEVTHRLSPGNQRDRHITAVILSLYGSIVAMCVQPQICKSTGYSAELLISTLPSRPASRTNS
jgi:hypothetical protein